MSKLNRLSKVQLLGIFALLLSADISFFIYTYFNLAQGVWSVMTVSAVFSTVLSNLFIRSILRMLGTFAAALYAYWVIVLFGHDWLTVSLLTILGVLCGSMIMVQRLNLNYFGLIFLLTLIIVIATGLESADDFYTAAVSRTYEVCLGIAVTMVTTLVVFKLFLRGNLQENNIFRSMLLVLREVRDFKISRQGWFFALKVLLATAITFIPWLYFRYPGGFWAPMSCYFVMEESLENTQQKVWIRFLAHLSAALYGLVVVFWANEGMVWQVLALTVGFVLSGYVSVQNDKTYRAMGATMGVAVAIMLLAGNGVHESMDVICARFFNVVFGITIGLGVSKLLPTKC